MNEPTATIAEETLLHGDVWAFGRDSARTMTALRQHLAEGLAVDPTTIHVVGSAKTGFSLSPNKFRQPFGRESDVDVVIIDTARFDTLWLSLVRCAYYSRWSRQTSNTDHNRLKNLRQDIAWGYINPEGCRFHDSIFLRGDKTLTNEQFRWWNTFRSLARIPFFAARDVSGRLYRTREHVIAYHAQGLDQIKAAIRATP